MIFSPIQAQSVFLIAQILICIQLVHILTTLLISGHQSRLHQHFFGLFLLFLDTDI